MAFKDHCQLVLVLVVFYCFRSGESLVGIQGSRMSRPRPVPRDFCVSRHATPTLCQRYLEIRTSLNLSRAMRNYEKKRSCFRRCSSSRRGKSSSFSNCFCDKLCWYYGDCCADYDLWCRRHPQAVHTNLACRFVHGETETGFLMIDKCPSTWRNTNIKQKCEADSSELLTILPVIDGINNTLYKNVFCAVCNEARNLKYWKVEVDFLKPSAVNVGNQTLKNIFAQASKWKFVIHDNYTKYVKYCKPQHPGCKNGSSLGHLVRMNSSELHSVCNSYSFFLEVSYKCKKEFYRNLHCMLCDGRTNHRDDCNHNLRPMAPQTIAFDFVAHGSSSSSPHISRKTNIRRYRCDTKSVYNPFTDQCQSLNEENTVNNKTGENNKTEDSVQVAKSVQTTLRNFTCMKISGNSSQNISVFSNGSLVINGKVRDDVKLEVIDNSSFICWNHTQSSTYTFRGHSEKDPSETVLEVITAVGFALSSTCLLFLLVTYTVFRELRTTPGKCVMSLSCALLLYMACHVPVTSTSLPILCVANAIVFQYSVLSVFAWLSVFAFDISKRFGSKAIETVAARADRSKTAASKRCDSLFLKYCAYSWGIPLAIVCICIVLDITDTFRFGHGQGLYCYISTSQGIKAAVIAPVSAVLVFNITALIRTILGIHKLKKDTSIASQPSSQFSSAILYLKLTCLFGLSWILNILFAFTQNIFVAYLAVLLNSCQGIFIFMGFCFNERVLNFYKTKLGIAPKMKRSQTSSEGSQSNFNASSTRL